MGNGGLTMPALRISALSDPRLIDLLKDGAIGVMPTDTVYGLVGIANNQLAITRLYHLKSRARQPGTTIAATTDQLIALGFPRAEVLKAARFWPNAVSVEMSATSLPTYLSDGQEHMAARIPAHSDLQKLILTTGPLMTTSANTPNAPTSQSIDQAIDYFGEKIDFYVDIGPLGDRPPSTIIGFDSAGEIIVYRQGVIPIL